MLADVLDVAVVLVLGGVLNGLCRHWQFPSAVAQVLLGVLLGGAVLGVVVHTPVLHDIGQVGVVLLLGLAGLELGMDRLAAAGWSGVMVALLGVGLSFLGAFAVAWWFGSPVPERWYVALVFTATSIGISVQVLEQFGLVEHRVGEIVIAAAVVDDVLALYLLGAAHGIFGEGQGPVGALLLVVEACAVLGTLYWAARFASSRWKALHAPDSGWLRGGWTVGAVLLGAALTDLLGLSAVVGGFFVGLGVGDGLGRRLRGTTARGIGPLVWITMPFFFVMIGVQADWGGLAEPGSGWLLAALLVVGVAGKALGGWLGASGLRARERWLVGLGMVGRGEVAMVVATLGYAQDHLSRNVFVVLISATILLAVVGPLTMAPLARRTIPLRH